jgi:N-acetylmuramoyl-L-alanine amidase
LKYQRLLLAMMTIWCIALINPLTAQVVKPAMEAVNRQQTQLAAVPMSTPAGECAQIPQAQLPSSKTAEADKKRIAYTEKDVAELARIVYWEARGEPDKGQIAVANVVINRAVHRRWPDTIKDVIAQRNQFTPYRNSRYYRVGIPAHFYGIARRALDGERAVPDEYCFFSMGKARRYARDFIKIGRHYFGKPK